MFPSLPVLATKIIAQPFKRSQGGLFHGAVKQYGNNVPHSMNKTRRTWLPNIQVKRLYSRTMDQWIKLSLTTRALRCIDKAGGLDEYIMSTKAELLGQEGMRLRTMLRDYVKEQEKRKPRALRGLPAQPIAFGSHTPATAEAASLSQTARSSEPATTASFPTASVAYVS
ncbi:hypothetical protein BKA62DRAFT_685710 [Auriculariales sp. MPI-PUGE-AT-0066]|nr:hypothetical protein BKA62DRAFT_685710 [Auriculariales sp. MPI-PUGE-AT-0066]